jgi:protein-L-isoaspartate O-methyltransferase
MTMCVKVGDGYQGWPECGPFDAVIVTAALGHVPPPLIEQLKVGGRLIMPLGPADAPQQLTVIEKIAPSETQTRSIILVQFVPLPGHSQPGQSTRRSMSSSPCPRRSGGSGSARNG